MREPAAVARFEVTPRLDQRLAPAEAGVDFALSADGSRFVYVGVGPGGGTQLWQRALDALEADPVPGSEGATGPVLSPDGLTVAFAEAGAIKTIPLRGGLPVTLVSAAGTLNDAPAWGSDGRIYFSRDGITFRVQATGGAPEPVTIPHDGPQRYADPLPGGRGLLLSVLGAYPALSRIAVVGPEGGDLTEILTGTMARYAATGHIIHTTADGTLWAAPFDVERLEVTGPSAALVEGIPVKASGAAHFALSESGTLLHGTGAGGARELVWVSRAGQVEPVDASWTGDIGYPALSPDGTRLAVSIAGEVSTDVWVKQLDRGPSLRLTLEGSRSSYPTWTPDGRSVTFFSDLAGLSFDLWTKRADGSAQALLELDQAMALAESVWSPDGAWLVYRTDRGVFGGGDIMALRRGEDAAPVPLAATPRAELGPTLSPDGRWMAHVSNETGRDEIYVVPFPDAATTRIQVLAGGGTEPVWSRGSGELFYRSGQGDMVAVRVETEPTFSAGQASALFPATEYRADVNHRQCDVTADGQRFIMIRPVGGGVQSRLILVQHFFEQLRALVPN
jgi:Tol biopolymer transport system component